MITSLISKTSKVEQSVEKGGNYEETLIYGKKRGVP